MFLFLRPITYYQYQVIVISSLACHNIVEEFVMNLWASKFGDLPKLHILISIQLFAFVVNIVVVVVIPELLIYICYDLSQHFL